MTTLNHLRKLTTNMSEQDVCPYCLRKPCAPDCEWAAAKAHVESYDAIMAKIRDEKAERLSRDTHDVPPKPPRPDPLQPVIINRSTGAITRGFTQPQSNEESK